MVIGQVPEQADFVVAGGGIGGYVAALRAAQLGRRVTLVDRDGENGVGGVCLRVGCIPSKGLIEAAELAHRVGHAAVYGVKARLDGVDLAAFQTWKADLVGGLTDGVRGLLKQAGVRVMTGEVRMTRPDEIAVSITGMPATFLKFNDLVLATGSRPAAIPGFAVDDKTILDSTGALALDRLPKSLAIIGGGYIGLEIGIAFAKMGTRVVIVEALGAILPTMDRRLVRPVEKRLAELGVEVLVNAKAKGHTKATLTVEADGNEKLVAAEKVVVAVGRRPNTDDLSLESAGIRRDERGLLAVAPDRRLAPHIAAVGDITPGPALAHKASAEAIVAAEALCGRAVAFQPAAIPAVVFSDPEIATAGLTADEAKAAGIEAKTANFPLAALGRARTLNVRDGHLQLVSDAANGTIVGVHIVGPHASDLIAEGVLAIEMAATVEDLGLTIHPHPTMSELYQEAAHLALDQPIHIARLGKR